MIRINERQAQVFISAQKEAATRMHLAEQSIVMEEPQPRQPEVPSPIIVPPLPSADLRLHSYFFRQVVSAGRVVRFLAWVLMLYPRVRLFLVTIFSGFVEEGAYYDRMRECETCDRHLKRIVKTEPELVTKSYCMQCGCPEWSLSQLKRKNWFKGWKCPARRHPGPYPEDAYKRFVTLQAPKQGGCGGGKSHG